MNTRVIDKCNGSTKLDLPKRKARRQAYRNPIFLELKPKLLLLLG